MGGALRSSRGETDGKTDLDFSNSLPIGVTAFHACHSFLRSPFCALTLLDSATPPESSPGPALRKCSRALRRARYHGICQRRRNAKRPEPALQHSLQHARVTMPMGDILSQALATPTTTSLHLKCLFANRVMSQINHVHCLVLSKIDHTVSKQRTSTFAVALAAKPAPVFFASH